MGLMNCLLQVNAVKADNRALVVSVVSQEQLVSTIVKLESHKIGIARLVAAIRYAGKGADVVVPNWHWKSVHVCAVAC